MTGLLVALISLAPPAINMRVEGDGFFRLGGTTHILHTRQVNLIWQNNRLETPEGFPLIPVIRSANPGMLTVGLEGEIKNNGLSVGRVVLANFDPKLARKQGAFLIAPTRITLGNPGEGFFGVIRGSQPDVPAPTPKSPESSPPKASLDLPTIVLPKEGIAEGDKILLGDIATISGPAKLIAKLSALELGNSPLPGYPISIAARYVRNKVRSLGIGDEEVAVVGPSEFTVSRTGQLVDPALISSTAIAAVKDGSRVKYDLVRKGAEPIYVVPGNLSVSTAGVNKVGDEFRVNLIITVNGKPTPTKVITVVPSQPVVTIAPSSKVRVRYRSKGITVTLDGVAVRGGATGDSIQVKLSDGVTMTGVLNSDGEVEVSSR